MQRIKRIHTVSGSFHRDSEHFPSQSDEVPLHSPEAPSFPILSSINSQLGLITENFPTFISALHQHALVPQVQAQNGEQWLGVGASIRFNSAG